MPDTLQAETDHRTKGLLRLTMACNERCPFCNVPAEAYPSQPTPDEALQQGLDELLRSGARTLTLSGGEPTLLRSRLLTWVRKARAAGLDFVELQTNAILIDEAYAQALAQAGLTSAFVSLLSDLGPLHDELAGFKGAFPRCLRGIDALLDAGVRVTLNPVVAALTQDRLPDYMRFVVQRLPRVRSVSLSAVQPHGRAASHPELLPDYGRLGQKVQEARVVAEAAGVELLNPYCGLPLCVGWQDAWDRSVEALIGDTSAPGLENQGDKSQGPPCRSCALRTRCGGAWHAVWTRPEGHGLRTPLRKADPWDPTGPDPGAQTLLRAPSADPDTLARLAQAQTPTRWLWAQALRAGDAERLLGGPVTDLALDWDRPDRETLVQLRRLQRGQAGRADPQRLRVIVGWHASTQDEAQRWERAQLTAALGVDGLRLIGIDPQSLRLIRRGLPIMDMEVR